MSDCRQRLTSNNTVDDAEASESCKIENDRYRNEIVAGKCLSVGGNAEASSRDLPKGESCLNHLSHTSLRPQRR